MVSLQLAPTRGVAHRNSPVVVFVSMCSTKMDILVTTPCHIANLLCLGSAGSTAPVATLCWASWFLGRRIRDLVYSSCDTVGGGDMPKSLLFNLHNMSTMLGETQSSLVPR